MPYYAAAAGDYYQGDNYAAGGLFSSIGKILGGVAKTAVGFLPGGNVISSLIPSFNRPKIAGLQAPVVPVPGLTGFGQRLVPGGASGFMLGRRRRINPLNIKALRRAMRRAKGFEKQARRVGSFFSPGKTYRLKGRSRKRAR